MNVVVLGAGGQLGKALASTCPGSIKLHALSHTECDITDPESVSRLNVYQPDLIINCAAYTAVDRAEQEVQQAYKVNALGPEIVAHWCATHGVYLLQISTDFVFSGGIDKPLDEEDLPFPCSVYGKSKLMGEQAVRSLLPTQSAVVRTSWLYSTQAPNFVLTMLKLFEREQSVKVVQDQRGSPTSATGLAQVLWALVPYCLSGKVSGIYHWSDGGDTTWYEFASEISQIAYASGLLNQPAQISPISSVEYGAAAKRPAYSVLSCKRLESLLHISQQPWQKSLQCFLNGI